MEQKTDAVIDDLPDPDLKIILLGDSAVGKSKLIERYLMDEYNPRQVRQIYIIITYCFYNAIKINCFLASHSFPHTH
jgi:GTPase SAR1 family protein